MKECCERSCECCDKGYQDMDVQPKPITKQPQSLSKNSAGKNVKHDKLLSDFKDDIIDENSIEHRFGYITRDSFQMLKSKAIDFTHKAKKNGETKLLENTKLNIYENENCYRQTSGNGINTIIVNFENEKAVVEVIGFKH